MTWVFSVSGGSLVFVDQTAQDRFSADLARAIAEQEIAHVDATGRPEGAGLLLAQVGFVAWFHGNAPAAIRLARRALELTGDHGDGQAQTRARMVEVLAQRRIDQARQRAITAHRANAEFARGAGLTSPEATALYTVAITTTRLEDFEATERAATEAGTFYALLARVMQSFVHTLEGRPDKAETLLARGGAALRHGVPHFAVTVDTTAAHLCLHRGELERARALLAAPSAETEPA